MSVILHVEHVTTYRYANPVTFGEHRVMVRPRSGYDLRVLDVAIDVSPASDIRWVQDAFSNSVTLVTPREPSTELRIAARFAIEHFGTNSVEMPLASHAQRYPFAYSSEERIDLGALLIPQHGDSSGSVQGWANQFIPSQGQIDTSVLLQNITEAVKVHFTYMARDTEGTQEPELTLSSRCGTCRDFALLMIEVVRRLGMAARFVSGYLYDPAADGLKGNMVGGGATHAWVEVYLPGAGWLSFDPTNRLYGGTDLIRVATTRDPFQAQPESGSSTGSGSDFLGMEVSVHIRRIAELINRTQQGVSI